MIRFRYWPVDRWEIVTGYYSQEVGVNVTPDRVLNYASRLKYVWGSGGLDSQIPNVDNKLRRIISLRVLPLD